MHLQRCVEIGQKLSQAQQRTQGDILLVFGCLVSFSAILNKTEGKRICCRLRGISAHADQERPEFG